MITLKINTLLQVYESKFIVTKKAEMIVQTAQKMLGLENSRLSKRRPNSAPKNEGITIKMVYDTIKNLYTILRSFSFTYI